jgi:hypothetical protein
MFVLVKTQSNGLLGVLEKTSVNDTSLYNNRFGIRLRPRVSQIITDNKLRNCNNAQLLVKFSFRTHRLFDEKN